MGAKCISGAGDGLKETQRLLKPAAQHGRELVKIKHIMQHGVITFVGQAKRSKDSTRRFVPSKIRVAKACVGNLRPLKHRDGVFGLLILLRFCQVAIIVVDVAVYANFGAVSGYFCDEPGVPIEDNCRNKEGWAGIEGLHGVDDSIQRAARPLLGEAEARKDGPEAPKKVMQPFGFDREGDKIHADYPHSRRLGLSSPTIASPLLHSGVCCEREAVENARWR